MTLFLDGTLWKVAERTAIGFRHTVIGRIVGFPTREDAVRRAHDLDFTEVR